MSNVVDKIKNKVEEVLHKDHAHTTNTTGTNVTGTHTTGAHHHGANVNDPYTTNTITGNVNNTATGTVGPHSSNLANKLDPRVDSDADGSRNAGIATYGPGATHNAATGPARDTAGPHASNTLNKLDPRVDSDADGSHNAGLTSHGAGAHAGAGTFGTSHNTYGNTGGAGVGGTGTVGPHSSNIANKLDPRVDSDADGSKNLGAANYGPGGAANTSGIGAGSYGSGGLSGTGGVSGAGVGSTNYGPHSSNLANKLDPRVDSDADGSNNLGAASYGPGGAANNAGTYDANRTY